MIDRMRGSSLPTDPNTDTPYTSTTFHWVTDEFFFLLFWIYLIFQPQKEIPFVWSKWRRRKRVSVPPIGVSMGWFQKQLSINTTLTISIKDSVLSNLLTDSKFRAIQSLNQVKKEEKKRPLPVLYTSMNNTKNCYPFTCIAQKVC